MRSHSYDFLANLTKKTEVYIVAKVHKLRAEGIVGVSI